MSIKNFKITIEYDGTPYCGWQIQKNENTVQGVLKECLESITKQKDINIIGSGRTDSGVHALGQVFNVKTETNMNESQMLKALNAKLPKDIHVVSSAVDKDDFNARFSASNREYLYKIKKTISPFDYKYYWNYQYDYDIEILKECAEVILEKRNFYNFCKPSKDIDNYKCIINTSDWSNVGDVLIYKINANRFLHHMVRMLVGTMLDVSNGKISVEQFSGLFENKGQKKNILTAPPQGLYLFKVCYN